MQLLQFVLLKSQPGQFSLAYLAKRAYGRLLLKTKVSQTFFSLLRPKENWTLTNFPLKRRSMLAMALKMY